MIMELVSTTKYGTSQKQAFFLLLLVEWLRKEEGRGVFINFIV